MAERVMATEAAAKLVRRLQAEHGEVVFFQSGGCCDGSSPMCLTAAEMPPGPNDIRLGEIAGAPVYIDAEQDARWRHPNLLIDVAPGAATSFSLEGGYEVHFVVRTPGDGEAS